MASPALLAVMACALAQPALQAARPLGLSDFVGVSGQTKVPALGSNGERYLAAWVNTDVGAVMAARVSALGQVLDVPALILTRATGIQQLSVAALPGGDFFVALDAASDGGADVVLLRVGAADGLVAQVTLPSSPGALKRSTPALTQVPGGVVLALRSRVGPANREQLQVLKLGAGGAPQPGFQDVGDVGGGSGFSVPLFAGLSGTDQLGLCDPLRGYPLPQSLLRFGYPGLAALPPSDPGLFPTAFAGVPNGFLVYSYVYNEGDTAYAIAHVDRDGGRSLVAQDNTMGELGAFAVADTFTYVFLGSGWAKIVGTTFQQQPSALFTRGQFPAAAAAIGEEALALSQRKFGTGALEGRRVTANGPAGSGPFLLTYGPSRMGEPATAASGGARLHVWTEERGDSGTDLYGALEPTPDGGVGAPFTLCASPTDEAAPSVAADETGFSVAFVSRGPESFSPAQLRFARVWPDGGLDAQCGAAIDAGTFAGGELVVAASAGKSLVAWRSFQRGPVSAALWDSTGAVSGPVALPAVTGGVGLAAGGDTSGWFLSWASNGGPLLALSWATGLPPADGGVQVLSRGLDARGVRATTTMGLRALAWLERPVVGGELDVAYQVVDATGAFGPSPQRMGAPKPYASVELGGTGGRVFTVASAPSDAGTLALTWFEPTAALQPPAPWGNLPAAFDRLAFVIDPAGGALDSVRTELLAGAPRLVSQPFAWARPGEACGAQAVCGGGVCSAGLCCDRPCATACSTGLCIEELPPPDAGPGVDGGSSGSDAGAAPAAPFGYPCGCGTTGPLAPLGLLAWALLRAGSAVRRRARERRRSSGASRTRGVGALGARGRSSGASRTRGVAVLGALGARGRSSGASRTPGVAVLGARGRSSSASHTRGVAPLRALGLAAALGVLLFPRAAAAQADAPAEVLPPKVRPQLGLYGAGEVLGRRLGLEVEAGVAVGQLAFALRVAPGPSVGLGLDAQYRLLRSVVSPVVGLRAAGYAALGAWGGGLLAALEVRALPQLAVRARFSAEYLFGPASVQHVLLVAGLGVTVSFE